MPISQDTTVDHTHNKALVIHGELRLYPNVIMGSKREMLSKLHSRELENVGDESG